MDCFYLIGFLSTWVVDFPLKSASRQQPRRPTSSPFGRELARSLASWCSNLANGGASVSVALMRLFDWVQRRCGATRAPLSIRLRLPAWIPPCASVIEAELHQPVGAVMVDHEARKSRKHKRKQRRLSCEIYQISRNTECAVIRPFSQVF